MGIVDYAARALGYDEGEGNGEWFTYGSVTAVTDDVATVNVGGPEPIDAAKFCDAAVGDVVLLVVMNGRAAAIARRGGDVDGGSDTTYTIDGSVANHAYTTTLKGSDGSTDTATLHLAAGANVTLTDGTDTVTIAAKDTTYSAATTSTAGLMSATDKAKLDGITASADAVSVTQSLSSGTKVGTVTVNGTDTDLYAPTPPTVDSALDSTSTNPVQNKAIVTALAAKQDTITAGTGLSKSGSTLNHSNSVTAGTAGTSSATSGNTLAVPYVTYDAQGHVTASGAHTHTSWDNTTPWLLGDAFQNDQKAIAPWPYINVLNNGYYSLIARGATVTMTIDGTTTSATFANLFDGNYDSTITTVPDGSTAVLTIDFSTMATGWFPETAGGYSYGDIILSFYYRCGAASVTARGYTDYNSIGWRNITVQELYTGNTTANFRGTKWRLVNPGLYHMSKLEITYVGKASGTTPAGASLTQVELNQTRPNVYTHPYVNKYVAETLYHRLTAPQFKGVFEGNSSWYGTCSTAAGTAAKAVTCSGFVLATGATLHVYCSTANSVTGNWTLNVNGTGAKLVYKRGSQTSSGNGINWDSGDTVTFVYNGTAWVYCGQVARVGVAYPRLGSANTTATGDASMYHFLASSAMTTAKPGGDGHIIQMNWDGYGNWASQLYLCNSATSAPAWRGQAGSSTWATMDWDRFFTHAFPPAFSDLTGTADSAQLPIATSSAVGAVRPDGQSIIVQDGVLTATPAAVGLTCTERKGGTQLDDISLVQDGQAWPSGDSAYGWKEEVWNDGRLHVQMWGWWSMTTTGVQNRAVTFDWTKCDTTKFVDRPTVKVNTWVRYTSASSPVAVYGSVNEMSANNSINLVLSKGSGGGAYAYVMLDLEGHWHIEGQDEPDDPSDYGDWTVGDAISIGGSTYYPVTDWTVSSTGAGGDNRLKAAVRFLITADSTSGAWHVKAQYAAWTDTGYVNTNNGYMLIRKLNSNITTYTNDAGVKAKGDVWSTLDQNQRQGYVYNGVVSGNLIWGDTPYIITDCGTVGNGVTVTSKTFYVGTTESGYPQCSVSASTTTPSA